MESKLIILVMACARDEKNGCANWFRSNLQNSPVPYRLFFGRGCVPTHANDIILPVDDSYKMLPWKVQATLKWALEQPERYTHFFKTDCDTRLWPDRLLDSDFSNYDYTGLFADGHVPAVRDDTYARGAGYCLSRLAAELVVRADVKSTVPLRMSLCSGEGWLEDEFVGKVLVGTNRHDDEQRYACNYPGRGYSGPTDNLIILGNSFDNKSPLPSPDWISTDGLSGAELKLAQDVNTRMRSGDAAGAYLLSLRLQNR